VLKDRKFKKSALWGTLLFIATGYLWLVFHAKNPQLPTAASPLLLYSNQTRHDLKQTLRSALKSAKEKIFLSMYALTDPEMLALLREKVSQGVAVTVFYDPTATFQLKTLLPGADLHPVKLSGLMHRKIVSIDGALLFLGSANMTTQSLTMHDNLLVGLYHPPLAQFLTQESDKTFLFDVGDVQGKAWLLPDLKGGALREIVTALDGAKKKIHLAMFTLTNSSLIDALLRAHRRGVVVKCAVDYYAGQGASAEVAKQLEAAGVQVFFSRGQELLHHKWALIDRKTLILGSANWTAAAFARNKDCFVVLSPLKKEHRQQMKRLWKTIERESECQHR
jgi:cardiolipin synthase